jgi:8-oxo-dGTP pyrophosphatase MutT (NUDIX family)
MVEILGKYRSWNKWKFSSLTTETNWNIYAVAWIVFRWKKYLITKNKRGGEIPAWHIELWETQVEALEREVMEEVWAKVISSKLIWYQNISLKK